MKENKYYIVNDFDCPEERLIAEKRGDSLFYIDAGLINHGPMSMGRATLVTDFGITLHEEDGYLIGERVAEIGVAKYANGDTRRWQGSDTFKVDLSPKTQREYTVSCLMELEATSPRDAAKQFAEWLLECANTCTYEVKEVGACDITAETINLTEEEDE